MRVSFLKVGYSIGAMMILAATFGIAQLDPISLAAGEELTAAEKHALVGAGPANCNFSSANQMCSSVNTDPATGALTITTCGQTSPAPPPAAGCGGDTSCAGTNGQASYCDDSNTMTWLCVSAQGNGNLQTCTVTVAAGTNCGNKRTGGACAQFNGTCTCANGSLVLSQGKAVSCGATNSGIRGALCPAGS